MKENPKEYNYLVKSNNPLHKHIDVVVEAIRKGNILPMKILANSNDDKDLQTFIKTVAYFEKYDFVSYIKKDAPFYEQKVFFAHSSFIGTRGKECALLNDGYNILIKDDFFFKNNSFLIAKDFEEQKNLLKDFNLQKNVVYSNLLSNIFSNKHINENIFSELFKLRKPDKLFFDTLRNRTDIGHNYKRMVLKEAVLYLDDNSPELSEIIGELFKENSRFTNNDYFYYSYYYGRVDSLPNDEDLFYNRDIQEKIILINNLNFDPKNEILGDYKYNMDCGRSVQERYKALKLIKDNGSECLLNKQFILQHI